MGNSHEDFGNPAGTIGESNVAVGVEKKGDNHRGKPTGGQGMPWHTLSQHFSILMTYLTWI